MHEEIKKQFVNAADPEQAPAMSAYMKNLFPFLGIKKPKRAELQKTIFKHHPITTRDELKKIISSLWAEAEREYHYAALDLAIRYKKLFSEDDLSFFESLIRKNSWWDSVDTIAPHLIGSLLSRFTDLKEAMHRWIDDDNFWIRRAALLFQLRYKEMTDFETLAAFCLKQADEKEFFIRKAIGWSLREYAKTSSEPVLKFVAEHENRLSLLSVREARKHFI